MKTRIAMKYFNRGNSIQLPYCGARNLLSVLDPVFYNCGVYGCNCDIYRFDGVYITTGYRNTRGVKPAAGTVADLDKTAEKILNDYTVPYETRREKIYTLICNLLHENGFSV